MKILITGNSGYIGSHLSQMLSSHRDLEIYGLDKNYETVKIHKHFIDNISWGWTHWSASSIEYDCVIHLAAEVSVSDSVENATKYYTTNTIGTLNCLEKLKFQNFIFASTGAAAELANPYGISKKAAEDIVMDVCSKKNIPYTIFRFYNVIGTDGFLPTNNDGLFSKLIEANTTGKFQIFGNDYNTRDGTCERDYTHVNEICSAVSQAIYEPTRQIENLGHGIGTTVKEMVKIFQEVNNCNFVVEYAPRRDGDIERSVLDNPSKFMKQFYTISDLLKI